MHIARTSISTSFITLPITNEILSNVNIDRFNRIKNIRVVHCSDKTLSLDQRLFETVFKHVENIEANELILNNTMLTLLNKIKILRICKFEKNDNEYMYINEYTDNKVNELFQKYNIISSLTHLNVNFCDLTSNITIASVYNIISIHANTLKYINIDCELFSDVINICKTNNKKIKMTQLKQLKLQYVSYCNYITNFKDIFICNNINKVVIDIDKLSIFGNIGLILNCLLNTNTLKTVILDIEIHAIFDFPKIMKHIVNIKGEINFNLITKISIDNDNVAINVKKAFEQLNEYHKNFKYDNTNWIIQFHGPHSFDCTQLLNSFKYKSKMSSADIFFSNKKLDIASFLELIKFEV